MSQLDIESRIIRYGELIPCKTAFIDAHTGSDQKENFTIIGAGVSESPDQHVHLALPHGFNIGAAGQPPKCRIRSIVTELLRYFCVEGEMAFFGVVGVLRVRLFFKKETLLIFQQGFLGF